MLRRCAVAFGLLLVLTAPVRAQSARLQLDLVVPGGTLSATEGPSIVGANLLSDAQTRELLRNGFPARLHYRAELWRESGWFDDRESVSEWDVLVSYDPASQLYRVVRQHGNQLEDFGGFASLTSAEEQIDRPYRVALRPRHRGRKYYYNLVLDIETLSVSDLDELQRWLHGELQPAVRGKTNPANAITSGIGALVSRILGGERRHFERRSETFTAP